MSTWYSVDTANRLFKLGELEAERCKASGIQFTERLAL